MIIRKGQHVGGNPINPAPKSRDFLWCRFPAYQTFVPNQTFHPVLVLFTEQDDGIGLLRVVVAFCTSNEEKVKRVEPGQFVIEQDTSSEFQQTGLKRTTKIRLDNCYSLPFTDAWFSAPDFQTPYGRSPQIGVFDESYRAMANAANALLEQALKKEGRG